MSTCQRPPAHYSFAPAISSISRLMSMPSQINPFSVRVYPDNPDPHPTSNTNDPSSRFNNSMALSANCLCIVCIRVLDSYFDA